MFLTISILYILSHLYLPEHFPAIVRAQRAAIADLRNSLRTQEDDEIRFYAFLEGLVFGDLRLASQETL